jgi:SPP1 gp7 family putative phage head morphogenesis protein
MAMANDLRDTATATREAKFIKDLTQGYNDALKGIKSDIAKVYDKYSIDGKLTMADMTKYDRLAGLEKKVGAELSNLNRGMTSMHKGYLSDVFEDNYYMTGYFLESETAKDISYSLLNRQAIYESVLSPMDKIGLESNAAGVRAGIKRSITQSLVQGQGIREMSQGITKSLEKNANNAARIARTETTGIMNKARVKSMAYAETKGFEIQKKWQTGGDDRVRDSHATMDGETVKNDKAFSNGLMYPGDQSGSAEEVINCRCASVEVVTKINKNRETVKVYGSKSRAGYNEWTANRLNR